MTPEQLVALALTARRSAYAPYSRHRVGAVVLGDDGSQHSGCNVENVSFGLTVCAERVAILKAVSAGHTNLKTIAIVSETGSKMCGACRQVFAEFASNDARIILAKTDGTYVLRTLDELLPGALSPDGLT